MGWKKYQKRKFSLLNLSLIFGATLLVIANIDFQPMIYQPEITNNLKLSATQESSNSSDNAETKNYQLPKFSNNISKTWNNQAEIINSELAINSKLQLANNNLKNQKKDSNDQETEDLENAFKLLNGQNFSLVDNILITNKENIWENLNSQEITNKINNSHFVDKFPKFQPGLTITYQIVSANWNIGELKLEATIKASNEQQKIAQFTINNFKTNDDIVEIAFLDAKSALENSSLQSKGLKTDILIAIGNVEYYLKLPEQISYEIRSEDGKEKISEQIDWEFSTEINDEEDIINISVQLSNEHGKKYDLVLSFDVKANQAIGWIIPLTVIGLSFLIILVGITIFIFKKHHNSKTK